MLMCIRIARDRFNSVLINRRIYRRMKWWWSSDDLYENIYVFTELYGMFGEDAYLVNGKISFLENCDAILHLSRFCTTSRFSWCWNFRALSLFSKLKYHWSTSRQLQKLAKLLTDSLTLKVYTNFFPFIRSQLRNYSRHDILFDTNGSLLFFSVRTYRRVHKIRLYLQTSRIYIYELCVFIYTHNLYVCMWTRNCFQDCGTHYRCINV